VSECTWPGCAGTFEADGYCNTCGRQAPAAAEPAPVSVPSTGARSTAGRANRTRSRPFSTGRDLRTTHRRIGGGLVELTPVVRRDPTSAILADPQVPENRRTCRACGKKPGRAKGFCPSCGKPYSFVPGLAKGDLVDKYEVLGCIAYGGLGWIYLARDTRLGDAVAERWVVLKGLIDVDDPDAVASAVSERRFLVEVDHPSIVKVHDFVRHPDPHTGRMVGYIVMEYLGGRSLHDIYRTHHDAAGQRAPLPLPTVLAYGMEVLVALRYLHDKGLVYCDLKPDNVIQVDDQVKLIDLGAVLRMSDRGGAIYGTPGYQAPEVERDADPSVASDLYTVGRMLAVLSFDFAGFSKHYRHRLPDPADVPLLAEEESFRRLLTRATDPDPARRFASADEMREQLQGVLAEVLSNEDGMPRPAPSTRFTPERRAFGTDMGLLSAGDEADRPVDWAAVPQSLPTPLVELADPAAGYLATLGATEPDELIEALHGAPTRSPEVVLRLVDAHLTAGDLGAALGDLEEFERISPTSWRASWYRGLIALARQDPAAAREAFGAVYDALPGELAPKLALAAAAEWDGDDERAETLYDRVWRTDTGYVSAAFGLARVLRRSGRLPEVVEALDGVPDTSSQHVVAQVAAIRARIDPDRVDKVDLLDASSRLNRLKMDLERQARLSVEVLSAKLNWTLTYGSDPDFDERALRLDLERAYRNLAKVADDPDRRSRLVDHANRVRPKTLF
jgi:serine/threonine-protein kinase PknG